MTQQVFADYIGLAPATLSSIFNDRTRPTLNVVELIKKKIPNISTDWLLFGVGDMYDNAHDESPAQANSGSDSRQVNQSPMFDFHDSSSPTPQQVTPRDNYSNSVRNTHSEVVREEIKIVDKPQRRVFEIRVYYDDQTWETFIPSKK